MSFRKPLPATTRGTTINQLIEMLTYMRPSGSRAARAFGRKFLQPVFGQPDPAGNYVLRVGDAPRVMFTAHYDTVHRTGGVQKVSVDSGKVKLPRKSKSNCLGADCTTGVWLILQMIAAKVPGLYAVFADEEIGCVGSSYFVMNRADEITDIDAVISFDRLGYTSIITHQSGFRTASDKFAASLESILDMGFRADDGGSFTDSNEFALIVPECSNISVGYFNQHGRDETQDLDHAEELARALIAADWSQLVIARDPSQIESRKRVGAFDFWDDMEQAESDLRRIVRDHPDAVAALLAECGYQVGDVLDYVDRGTACYGDPYKDYDPDTGLTMQELFDREGF